MRGPLLMELAADESSDEATRQGAARAVASAQAASHEVDPADLLAHDDPEVRASALRIAAHAGHRLDDPTRTRLLTAQPGASLYALGMTGDPALTHVARCTAYDPETRHGTRWWLAAGGRVAT